ncbi:MAG: topoisomerase DNA-binding C4 zinc finger domain-containing protein, partial [Desulfobulbaceae bacterium]|nr:topoisomerase DNA-binding C4 zinc finger domain-containing protein [Desulfobulbaceae bacterium]
LKATNQANQVVAILSRAFPQMQGVNLSAYIEQTINEALTSRKDLTFALRQFDQTLMLHGKALIKTKTPARVSTTRSRASSTIIKQATPTPVAIETDTSPIATNAPLPPAEAKQPTTDEAIIKSSHPASQTLETRPPTPPPQDEQSITIEIEDTDAGTPLSDKLLSHDKPEPESALETNTPPEDLLKLFTDSVSNKSAVADATNQRPEHTPQPPLDSKEKNCPACGKSLVIKQDQFGTYWGCSGFPTCRYSENTQEFPCPLCGHALTRKQTPTGKDFFSCAHNDCQFMSWSTPHYLPCGLCNSPYLVEKIVQGGTQLRCPRAGCSYGQPLPEQSTENRSSPTGTSQKKIMVRRTVPGTGTAAAGTKKVRIVRRKS